MNGRIPGLLLAVFVFMWACAKPASDAKSDRVLDSAAAPDVESPPRRSGESVDSAMLPRFTLQDLVLKPELSTLGQLVARFGGSVKEDTGDESDDARLCYRVRNGEEPLSVVFGATSMGGPERGIGFIELTEKAATGDGTLCPIIDGPIVVEVQGVPIAPGMDAAALEAALRVTPHRAADTLTFDWARTQLGPYKTLAGKDTLVTWDLTTELILVAPGGRVQSIRLSHVTSY